MGWMMVVDSPVLVLRRKAENLGTGSSASSRCGLAVPNWALVRAAWMLLLDLGPVFACVRLLKPLAQVELGHVLDREEEVTAWKSSLPSVHWQLDLLVPVGTNASVARQASTSLAKTEPRLDDEV